MKYRYPVFIAMSLLLRVPAAPAQIPTFSVKTEEVCIDVLVSDNGKPVRDLQASDFEVLDNGVKQEIKYAGARQMSASAILVLDMSVSVTGYLMDRLKRAGEDFLGGLRNDDRAALITFSRLVKLDAPITSDISKVKAALNQAMPDTTGTTTSMIDAAFAGLIYAESKADNPLIVIFSDGLDTSSRLTAEAVLNSARHSDVLVYAVSAGKLSDREFLRNLCEFTGGTLFEIESTENMSSVFINILDEFRQRYLLTYSPQGVERGGWHELEVRVRKHSHDRILARPGYMSD